MDKRAFLKTTGILAAGLAISPRIAASIGSNNADSATAEVSPFTLPALGYAFNALEPAIDAQTMEIHHDKHHGAYVTNLNKALAENEKFASFKSMTIEEICANLSPDMAPLRNNGGGHYNHSKFWNWIKPGGAKQPTAIVSEAINEAFGSYDKFVEEFSNAAKTRFGSGWAWLSVNQEGRLFISSTANQDNPLMKNIPDTKVGTPILGLDVWEHAYYLHYQNLRVDYIKAFFSIINWDVVEAEYKAAKGKK